jgi:hypothetical protein
MSNSTGSSPTTSRSVPHSSQDTISPLSVSKSTWTSASHSGHVPVGTFSSSPAMVKAGIRPESGEHRYLSKQPNQSNRERWNLQYSFVQIVGPIQVTFLCRKYFSCKDAKAQRKATASSRACFAALRLCVKTFLTHCGSPHLTAPYETNQNAVLT